MKIEYYAEFGERSSHTGREVAWYREVEGEIENFILNTFINFKPLTSSQPRDMLTGHCSRIHWGYFGHPYCF